MTRDLKSLVVALTSTSIILCAGCSREDMGQIEATPSQVISGSTEEGDGSIFIISDKTSDRSVSSKGVTTNSTGAASAGCDLTGKWISTQRLWNVANYDDVTQSYQLAQRVQSWAYWEFAQNGTLATVKRGLQCGAEIDVIPLVPIAVDTALVGDQKIFKGVTRHNTMQGRTAVYSAKAGSDECQLMIEKAAMVEGATFSYFKDFAHPLTQAKTAAQGTTPGWEDWDEDGSPGVTYQVSGIATGNLYAARRELVEYRGITAKQAKKFKLDVIFQYQHLVISTNPTKIGWPVFKPSTDQEENWVWFVRVDNSASWNLPENSNDQTVCAMVRQLKGTLIPEGEEE
jgi:hypothetical protein